MGEKAPTQVERLQAGLLAKYDEGVRWGECNGALGAVRRMLADRGLLAELTGRAVVADLVRRYGRQYLQAHLALHGLLELADRPAAAAIVVEAVPVALVATAEDYDPLADEGP